MSTSLLLVAIVSLSGCSRSASDAATDPNAPVAVTLATAETAPMPEELDLVGTLVADHQVQVAADTNGVVTATKVERGDLVEKGAVLALVDTRVSSLTSVAQRAQASAQASQLDAADLECRRAEELFSAGAISQAQLDRARAACTTQRSAAAAAAASSDLASTNLDRTSIRAPFAGVVGERLVEIGSFVAAQTPVVTLYAPGPLRLRMTVPETQTRGVEVGGHVSLKPSADLDHVYGATVRFVSGAVREQTRDLVVEAVLDEASPNLRPGMFAAATLDIGERPMLVVPSAAIVDEGPVHRVFRVVEQRAIELVVRVGPERDGKRAVLSDLATGDVVVVAPPPGLRDGGRVK